MESSKNQRHPLLRDSSVYYGMRWDHSIKHQIEVNFFFLFVFVLSFPPISSHSQPNHKVTDPAPNTAPNTAPYFSPLLILHMATRTHTVPATCSYCYSRVLQSLSHRGWADPCNLNKSAKSIERLEKNCGQLNTEVSQHKPWLKRSHLTYNNVNGSGWSNPPPTSTSQERGDVRVVLPKIHQFLEFMMTTLRRFVLKTCVVPSWSTVDHSSLPLPGFLPFHPAWSAHVS